MVVETSPQNYQVWIRCRRELSLDEKRHWLKKLGSDPGADPNNRWGRCPGFRNRKDKHRNASGQYPLARLIWIDWTSQAQVPDIITEAPISDEHISHTPRRGSVCCRKKICRADYDRGGESETDFAYALALARRGHGENEIRSRLLSERTSWGNHARHRRTDLYLDRTIRKAKAIVEKTRHLSK